MTIDATIPLWGLLVVLCAVCAKLLDRYCVEAAEAVIKFVSGTVAIGLSREARLLWQRELVFHAIEDISDNLNAGRSRKEVAWLAIWNAANMVIATPSLRSNYIRRAASGERSEDGIPTASPRRLRSRLAELEDRVDRLRILTPAMMFVSILGLCLVLIPSVGLQRHGATRWIGNGVFSVQPADFAKLAVAMYLPAWLPVRFHNPRVFWRGFFACAGLVGAMCGLILLEPDLASAVIIGFTFMSVVFVAGAPARSFLAFSGISAVVALVLIVSGGGFDTAAVRSASQARTMAEIGAFLVASAALVLPLVLLRLKFAQRSFQQPFGSLMAAAVGIWVWYEVAFNIGWAIHVIPNDAVDPQLSITRVPNVVIMTMAIIIAGCVGLSRIARPNRA